MQVDPQRYLDLVEGAGTVINAVLGRRTSTPVAVRGIAWLAGLLEGDGTFYYYQSNTHTTPRIGLALSDQDVVQRAAELLRVPVFGPYDYTKYKNCLAKKPVYQLQCNGTKAVGWMMTLFTFMGIRRRQQIITIINRWKENPHAGGCSNFS